MEHQSNEQIRDLIRSLGTDFQELASKVQELVSAVTKLQTSEVLALLPKTEDGHPYIQHGDNRQFYCCWQNTETGVWSKATCKTVSYDEMIDENHLWSIDGLDLDLDHTVPCRVFLDEWNRDSTFEALEEERKTKELFG